MLSIIQQIFHMCTWPLRIILSAFWSSPVGGLARQIYKETVPVIGHKCFNVARLGALISAGLASSIGMFFVTVVAATSVYALLYTKYIPADYQTHPVFFSYSGSAPACAQVSLMGHQWHSRTTMGDALVATAKPKILPELIGVREVDIHLHIVASASAHNVNLGPVMFDLSLLEQNATLPPLAMSERPMLLPYRGLVSRLWHDLSPFGHQQIETGVQLFEALPVSPGWVYGRICMNPPLHLHHAELKFHSKLSGLKTFVRNRPILGGVFFIAGCSTLATVLIAVLLIWALLSYFSQEAPLNEEPQWGDKSDALIDKEDSESTDPVDNRSATRSRGRDAPENARDKASVGSSTDSKNQGKGDDGLKRRSAPEASGDDELD